MPVTEVKEVEEEEQEAEWLGDEGLKVGRFPQDPLQMGQLFALWEEEVGEGVGG